MATWCRLREAKLANRRVEELGSDLDSALSLLDVRQSRGPQTVGATDVAQSADRAVSEWSAGVVAKLSAGLLAGSRGGQQDKTVTNERHARNARRWLLDPRIWEAFLRSLEGSFAVDPNFHLPQGVALPVLRAAIFTVRTCNAVGDADGINQKRARDEGGECAGEWAAAAIRTMCGVAKVELVGDLNPTRQVPDHVKAGLFEKETGPNSRTLVVDAGEPEEQQEARVLMRITLDAYVSFLEEAVRGHGAFIHGHGTRDVVNRRAEAALTDLLRFQLVLQGNQSNRRKVFSTCCSRLIGPLFEILPLTGSLRSVITTVLWDALFHEEHLEGYREAFTAAETATPSTKGRKNVTSQDERGAKKRRRRDKYAVVASGSGSGAGGTGPRRACYQQQLLEELTGLARADEAKVRLGATRGAPLLLEGFIVHLRRAQDRHADIHQAASVATVANISEANRGSKKPRSSGTATHPGVSSSSLASQMFKMWASLVAALLPFSAKPSDSQLEAEPSQGLQMLPALSSSPLAFLQSTNAMLSLLARFDVYCINEDWGGRQFAQLRSFANKLLDLASTRTGAEVRGHKQGFPEIAPQQQQPPGSSVEQAEAEEFVRVFLSFLRLNHNILHGNLRTLLRMIFCWASAVARTESASAARGEPALKHGTLVEASGGTKRRQKESLRPLAVGLVVSLVDTYGRLRQMDHLVQAVFGAIADGPSASASVLRGDKCDSALARAFQRLPEGQIESMWEVFAGHLRASWKSLSTTAASAPGDEAASGFAAEGVGGGDLARELDAELFVLFLRNLHVTSSVASGVGKLCTKLARESLRTFCGALKPTRVFSSVSTAASTCAPAAPVPGSDSDSALSSSTKKKKCGKPKLLCVSTGEKLDEEQRVEGARRAAGAMLAYRPALDIHGWLLGLNTRCQFWSAILNAPSAVSTAESIPMAVDTLDDDADSRRHEDAVAETEGYLLRIISATMKAFESTHDRASGRIFGGTEAEARLRQTLQQVAVHRVQQIYARLNGAAALEGGQGARPSSGDPAVAVVTSEQEARLELEARELVSLACGACELQGAAVGQQRAWGDEDDRARAAPSWSMMMPYLPVWITFATEQQVELFLEALFSRCAADTLAGLTELESAPLRLLTDASFFEMEAIARAAPGVILGYISRAIKLVAGKAPSNKEVLERTGSRKSLGELVGELQSLVAPAGRPGSPDDDVSGDEWGSEDQIDEDKDDLDRRGGRDKTVEHGVEQRSKGVHENEQMLLLFEACCLVRLAERFPRGFFSDDAIEALMVAVDAMDAICFRRLLSIRTVRKRRTYRGTERDDVGWQDEEHALLEALVSLRSMLKRLGTSLPPTSPTLESLSPGQSLARVIRPIVGGDLRLLRLSARLTTVLAARCLATGEVEAVMAAASRLDTPQVNLGDESGRGDRKRERLTAPYRRSVAVRMTFLHSLLSGVVAGETRRLTTIHSARANGSSRDEDGSDEDASDDEKGSPDIVPSATRLWPSSADEPSPLFDLVARIVKSLPSAKALSSKAAPDDHPCLQYTPSALLVCGDALRLSFLDANAEELIFRPSGQREGQRSRTEWVIDAIDYLQARAKSVLLTATETYQEECEKSTSGNLPGLDGEEAQGGPSERSALCHLVRAVCGCCHLLKPDLPTPATEGLVRVILSVAAAAGSDTDRKAMEHSKRQSDVYLLQSSFCLLVQHASEVQLRAIVHILSAALRSTSYRIGHYVVGSRVADESGTCQPRSQVARPFSVGKHSAAAATAAAAIASVRLFTQAGGGAEFVSVIHHSALSLITALCAQLRPIEDDLPSDDRMGNRASCRHTRWAAWGSRLRHVTEVLEALDGLLNRHPYRSVSARVVSVMLGLVERAARTALQAAESCLADSDAGEEDVAGDERRDDTDEVTIAPGSKVTPEETRLDGSMSSFLEDLLGCFRACCGVWGAILQHYGRKVYSCTPPFAALCRSLLRLLFYLAMPKTARPRTPARSFTQAPRSNRSTLLSIEQQVAAASSLSRVLEQFVQHKEVLKKYSPYLILEYVALAGSVTLEPAPGAALHTGLFALMDSCTPWEMRQLQRLLGTLPTGQETFRSLFEEYQLKHKFTGVK